MKPKNFSARKQARQVSALARFEKSSSHSADIYQTIANTHRNIEDVPNPRIVRTKKRRIAS